MRKSNIIYLLLLCCFTACGQGKQKADKVTIVTEKEMPEFRGDMGQYLMQTLKIDTSIKGQEVVQFLVNPDGRLSGFKVIKSLGAACDKEVIRALEAMPPWKPGTEGGKPVATWYQLPMDINQ